MGTLYRDSIANKVSVEHFAFTQYSVPDWMSLEEAATILLAYKTVYYALIMRRKLMKGKNILIHAGSGGVGQAAVNVCLSIECEVHTTVGTDEKREFVKTSFGLSGDQIFDSRATSFADDLLRATNGRDVDVVLNSLSEEKLIAGVNCLADSGRFIEVAKYGMITNNSSSKSFFFCCYFTF